MTNVISVIGNMVGAGSNYFLNFLLSIIDIYLYCVLLLGVDAMCKKHRPIAGILRWCIYIAVSFLFVAELFVVLFYHSLISVYVMQLVMETNKRESLEFIATSLSSSALWKTIGVTALVLLLSLVVSKKVRCIPAKIATGIKFIVVLLVLWSGIRRAPAYAILAECFRADSVSYCSVAIDNLQLNSTSTRMAFDLAYHKASVHELTVLAKTLKDSKVTKCTYQCPLIVLVIGESYNKYHAHLYNKSYLPTTPHLDQLEQEGNLIKYTDMVTPYNLTSEVFKSFFSMNSGGEGEWVKHSFFPALFKKAGYKVYFITNQYVQDTNNDWAAVGGTFINDKRLSDLQFTYRNKHNYQYDAQLLSEIPDIEKISNEPTLLIIHLIGQHTGYDQRYPEEFNKFKSSDAKTPFGGEEGKEIEAQYANATLYNDFVVDSIFRMVKDKDAIGLYFSDHGEEVYDGRDLYFRTQERPIPPEIMPYQYEVPAVFYLSDTFKRQHPEIAARVAAAQHRPAMNVNLSHTLLWLAGISTPEYNKRLDVLSPEYDEGIKRMIWKDTPYQKVKVRSNN